MSASLLALTALGVSDAAGTAGPEPRRALAENPLHQAVLRAYRALPLPFVPNTGQLERRVRYSAQAGSASVFLMRRQAVLALAKGRRGLALRLRFLGASPNAMLTGAKRARVNLVVGRH